MKRNAALLHVQASLLIQVHEATRVGIHIVLTSSSIYPTCLSLTNHVFPKSTIFTANYSPFFQQQNCIALRILIGWPMVGPIQVDTVIWGKSASQWILPCRQLRSYYPRAAAATLYWIQIVIIHPTFRLSALSSTVTSNDCMCRS